MQINALLQGLALILLLPSIAHGASEALASDEYSHALLEDQKSDCTLGQVVYAAGERSRVAAATERSRRDAVVGLSQLGTLPADKIVSPTQGFLPYACPK